MFDAIIKALLGALILVVVALIALIGYVVVDLSINDYDCVKTGRQQMGIMMAGKVPVPYTYDETICTRIEK